MYETFFETKDDGHSQAVKISQQYTGQGSEVAFVTSAQNTMVDHLPKIIKHRDV